MFFSNHFSNQGTKLFYRAWTVDSPKALVVIAHGLGEHSGRYQNVAELLNELNYSVYALDHRGHGQSEGQKGHVGSFSEYHSDLHAFIQMTKNENPGLDCFLLGHSMGGLIATGYALRHKDIKGLIISAPAYGVPGKSANVQLKIGAVVGRFFPSVALANKIDPSFVCSTKSVVDAYIQDPLVHDQITLGWGRALLKEQKYVHEHLSELKLPVLMLVPQSDKLTDHTVTEHWFTLIPDAHKDIECYKDSYHEVLNEEVEGTQAMMRIADWLSANL